MCVRVFIQVFVRCLVNVYSGKFTLIFIIKIMELSLKIEMSHFIVSDIVTMRRIVTYPNRHFIVSDIVVTRRVITDTNLFDIAKNTTTLRP